jgi:hypothetical protein
LEADIRRFLPHLPLTGPVPLEQSLDVDVASLIYNGEGTPDLRGALAGTKTDPTDKTGGDFEAVSIKNFPRDVRPRGQRMRQAFPMFPVFEALNVIEKNGVNGQSQNGTTVTTAKAKSQSAGAQNGHSSDT